jgi:hypothetical protein
MLRLCAAVMVLACVVAAQASPRHRHHRHSSQVSENCQYENLGRAACFRAQRAVRGARMASDANGNRLDPRPRAWCGWRLRHHLGVADRLYNAARAWAHYGSRASGPAPGVIAVYPHHVGIVVSVPGPGRMVMQSGNDGHAVRTRERPTRGVIAWRWPPQSYAGL